MIRIVITDVDRFTGGNSGTITEFNLLVEGHSKFAYKGEDIVCAGVSVLAQTLLLSIEKLTGLQQLIKQEDGFLRTKIDLNNSAENTKEELFLLVRSFTIGIEEMAKNYKQFIVIEKN